MTIVGSNEPGGLTCNQCSFTQLYPGRKPGFPDGSLTGVKFIADPTSDFPDAMRRDDGDTSR